MTPSVGRLIELVDELAQARNSKNEIALPLGTAVLAEIATQLILAEKLQAILERLETSHGSTPSEPA